MPFSSPEEMKGSGASFERKEGPFANVLRSKGFVWLSNNHDVLMYWSQAGRQIDMQPYGRWWAAADRKNWPEEHIATILEDFSGDYGDRRQELVFIGPNMDRKAIEAELDACLATDDEMKEIEESFLKTGVQLGAFA